MQTDQISHLHMLLMQILNTLKHQSTLMEKQQSDIPRHLVKEYANISNDVILTLYPQSHNLEHITSMLIYVSSGPATLTLGRRVIPLAAGLTPLTQLDLFLLPDDQRVLTQPAAGPMFLELMGDEYPTYGQGGAF